MNPRSALALVVLLASPSLSAQIPDPSPPASPARAELEDLRTALETAIGRPSRMGFAPGAPAAGRVYRLKGYGAVIVLAPRALPARRFVVHGNRPGAPSVRPPAGAPGSRVVITVPEGTFDVGIDLGDLEREMEVQMAAQAAALRDMESAQREWTRARVEEMRQHLRLVEDQAEAFRLEAERARRKAEREVRTRLTPPPTPAAPPVPVAPPVPAVPEAPIVEFEVPPPPEPPDAPPPWRFWFDVTDQSDAPDGPDGMATPDADALVTSVRERLVAGLDAYRRPLASLRADEFVTVAVDLVPDLFLRARPTRTLLVRVRAGDLQEHRAGRLSGPEFRKRVEFEEN
jgi:hypothetical protein